MSQQACQRPGCTGSYEDVGGGELYCDTCGLAPVVAANGMVGSSPTGIAGASPGLGGSRGASRASGVLAGHTSGSADSSGHTSQPGSTGSARSSRSATSRRSVSGRLSHTLAGAATARSVSVRSSGTVTDPSGRGRLGAGLVKVPEVPRPDPRSMVLERPEVPERKRFCSRTDCGAPVGRSRGARAGRTEGFCTKCGHPYSFVPKLRPGDIVHGQYEVAGCLAHGGLGWIYLAVDRAVADRWVVLKGLLDTGDQDAMAAAISERRFLAEIEHSNIVRIYNFVEHLDTRTGSMDGYIVMEYVGGKSLKDIANSRRTPEGRRDPLPVDQACAYGIEALEALGHLHSRNLLYCDFKVDNAIQTEDQLKLIDMGAVRRMDDDESAIFGTVGYQAPEVAEVGPSVASDLHTVARTLAVLTFDFQGYTNVFANSLPDPDNIDVFRRYESFYRLLVRATDPDPARRFASAQEMAEQLTGVLREVVALQTGRPRPALSSLFGPELKVTDTELFKNPTAEVSHLGARALPERGRKAQNGRAEAAPLGAIPSPAPPVTGVLQGNGGAFPPSAALPAPGGYPQGAGAPGAPPSPTPATHDMHSTHGTPPPPHPEAIALAGASALALPVPRIDPNDPNAGFLAGLLATAPSELVTALRAAPADSPELRLCELRARLEMGELPQAEHILDALERDHPDDWRVIWYRGVVSLTTGDHALAALSFDAVYDAFPGEPAPKIALGVCAEVLGQLDNAAEYYRLVWTTDPSYVSAAFGLARVRFATGDRSGAVYTLESVPESSIHYTAARVAAVRARLRQRLPVRPAGGSGPEAHGTASTNGPAGAPHSAVAAGADASFLADLRAAADQVEALDAFGLDAVRRELLSTEVLGTALDWVLSGNHGSAPPHGGGRTMLLGSELDERGLRFGLERSYRTLARLANSGKERIELVERANRLRPRTWV